MEDELKESETFTTGFFVNSPNPILLINPDHTIRRVNPAFEVLTGFSNNELIGLKSPFPWWPPEKYDQYKDLNTYHIDSLNYDRERYYIKKNGEIFWVAINIRRVTENDIAKYFITNWTDITESKKAEEKFRYQAMLVDNVSEAIISTSLDGDILSWNKAAESIYGWTQEEAIGKNIYELLQIIRHTHRAPLKNIESYNKTGFWAGESAHQKRDGTVLSISSSICLIRDNSGKAIGTVGIFRDISRQKKAEEDLRYQAMLVDNVSEAIISTSLDGDILSWNKAAESIYGWPQEEAIGKNIYELLQIVRHTHRAPLKNIESYNKTGFWSGESAHQRRDGTVLSISSSICLIKDPSGNPIGTVGIFRDITKQKKAEEELKESERKLRESDERFQQTAMNAGEWIWEVDNKGLYLYSNPVVETMTGYSLDELIGKVHFFDLFPGQMRIDFATKVLNGELQQPVHNFVHNFIHKSGKQITLEANIVPVKNLDGITLGIRGVSTDITERKRAAEELEELYQKEKKQRLELQEEARARGMFLDVLAHELRTPLTPVLASTGMLKDLTEGQPNDIRKKLTYNIYNSTQTLAARLEELLDMARYSRGTFKLTLQPVELNQFFKDVLSRFKPSLQQRKQRLIEEVTGPLPKAEIDASRLEQVIINLLSNASKFSDDQGSIIFRVTSEDNKLQIDVKDSGIGISLESQERLFQPYHRVEQDRQHFPGLGLGLAIAKQIVEAHGGKIWLVSREGQGSTFSFSIPLVQHTTTNRCE